MSRHLNAGQNNGVKIDNRFFKNMKEFEFLGTTVSDQNIVHEKILHLGLWVVKVGL
jgi:hypothetical protein